jgi:hypothetical protein
MLSHHHDPQIKSRQAGDRQPLAAQQMLMQFARLKSFYPIDTFEKFAD